MNELSKIDSIISDPKELSTLKQICAKDSTDLEFKLLIEMSKALKLNPMLKEIYQIKTSRGAQTFISREGYRVIAQRQKNYDYHFTGAIYSNDTFKVVNGLVHHEYGNAARGELLGAFCVVKKHDSSREVSTVVKLSEFNKGQSNWVSMPEVMITKVAEASALRMAFASEFVGTYHESEEWEEKKKEKAKPVIEAKQEDKMIADSQWAVIESLIEETNTSDEMVVKAFKQYDVQTPSNLTFKQAEHFIDRLEKLKAKQAEEKRIEARQAEIDKELS